MEKVTLKPKREYTVVHRHPWVFSGAVAKTTGSPLPGETVVVCDSQGTRLGYGSYSPASQIRVRMLSFGDERAPGAALVTERVTLIPGLPPGDPRLKAILHEAELFVLPSLHEPFGIVALEAWAAGLPVVAARTGGLKDFIEEGRTGLLFDQIPFIYNDHRCFA